MYGTCCLYVHKTHNIQYRIHNTETHVHKNIYGPPVDTALYVML